MAVTNRLKAIPLELINSTTLDSVNFTAINSPGLPNACSIIRIVNDTDESVEISYYSNTAHDYIPAGGALTLDIGSNKYPNIACMLAKDTIISVRGTAGTGFIALAGYYQEVI